MSYYHNHHTGLQVGDTSINARSMGANLRLNTTGWSVWCQLLPTTSMWFRAVVDDFGNRVEVPS